MKIVGEEHSIHNNSDYKEEKISGNRKNTFIYEFKLKSDCFQK